MAVKSSTFGGVYLSGKSAEKFARQVKYGRPKEAALDSFRRGQSMADEFTATGKVIIRTKRTTSR